MLTILRAAEGIVEEGEDIDLISRLEDMTINKDEEEKGKLTDILFCIKKIYIICTYNLYCLN